MKRKKQFQTSSLGCSSGKQAFFDELSAEEALIQCHIKFNHKRGEGPINIYLCEECSYWHLTSHGSVRSIMKDPNIKKRMSIEKLGLEWQHKIK